ncbi:MAG TPA: lysylphosphatidylglycerol synthase transmembrane domain-containing protein [Pyrinomonadaceae bacterium]
MRKYLKFIALLLLATLILWWFGRGLNWAEVRHSLGQADWRLLAAAVAFVCVTYLLRAYRWGALLSPLTRTSKRELFVATTVGFAAVFVFGRAGEVVRPVVLPLRDRRVKPAASFVTIMIERLCDTMAVVVLFALNLVWFHPPAGHTNEFGYVREIGLTLLVVTLFGVLGLVWFERRAGRAIHWLDVRLRRWRFVPERLARAITHTLEQLARALLILADARELAVTVGWTSAVWLTIVAADLLVLRAFGLQVGVMETIFVMGFAIVGSLVPTPGGAAGAFHAATAAGLIFLGVATREQAAAASIVVHLVAYAPAIFFGLYYFLRGDVSIKRLRQLTSSEAIEHAVEDEDEEQPAAVAAAVAPDGAAAETDAATPEKGIGRRAYG